MVSNEELVLVNLLRFVIVRGYNVGYINEYFNVIKNM